MGSACSCKTEVKEDEIVILAPLAQNSMNSSIERIV